MTESAEPSEKGRFAVRQLQGKRVGISGEMTIVGTVGGRIHVPSGAVLHLVGIAEGGVLVTGGGYAHISGTTRTLTVTVGGRATLTGTCHGPLVNDGGDVIIEGKVEGPIIEHAGRTLISPSARIRAGSSTMAPSGRPARHTAEM